MKKFLSKIINWFAKKVEDSVKDFEKNYEEKPKEPEAEMKGIPNHPRPDSYNPITWDPASGRLTVPPRHSYNNEKYYWGMPITVRMQFQYNYSKQKGGHSHFTDYIQESYHYKHDFYDFIGQAFNWSATPEGPDYWSKVAEGRFTSCVTPESKRFNNSIVNTIIKDCSNKNVKNLILTTDENRKGMAKRVTRRDTKKVLYKS